jgi:hypothetical protein
MNIARNLLVVALFALFSLAHAQAPQRTTEWRAKEIMGEAFVDCRTMAAYYGHTLTNEERDRLDWISFSEETLQKSRETHILVPGFPMTIAEIRAKVPAAFTSRFWDSGRHGPYFDDDIGAAANEKVRLQWFLLRRNIVQGSTSKTYDEAVRMLGPDEELPRACELVNAMVVYWLATGTKLFSGLYSHSSSLVLPCDGTYLRDDGVIAKHRKANVLVSKYGNDIIVGGFDERGIGGGSSPRKGGSTVEGIAPMRKIADNSR